MEYTMYVITLLYPPLVEKSIEVGSNGDIFSLCQTHTGNDIATTPF